MQKLRRAAIIRQIWNGRCRKYTSIVHMRNPKILPKSPAADHRPSMQPSRLGKKYACTKESSTGHDAVWNHPNPAKLKYNKAGILAFKHINSGIIR